MFQLKSSSNIYQTFKPFYWILKVFGFASYRLDERNQVLNVRLCDKMYTFMWIVIYLFFVALNSYWGEQEPAEDSILVRHGWHKLYIFETTFVAFAIFCNFINFKITNVILQTLNEFDIMTNMEFNWNFKLNHTKQRSLVIYFTIGCIFMAIVKIPLSIGIADELTYFSITIIFFYHLSIEMIALITWQLVFFSYHVQSRYEIIVENFMKLNLKAYKSKYEIMMLIEKYCHYHTQLVKTIKNINSIHSVQVRIYTNLQHPNEILIQLNFF